VKVITVRKLKLRSQVGRPGITDLTKLPAQLFLIVENTAAPENCDPKKRRPGGEESFQFFSRRIPSTGPTMLEQ
jgi:hypothetical protein